MSAQSQPPDQQEAHPEVAAELTRQLTSKMYTRLVLYAVRKMKHHDLRGFDEFGLTHAVDQNILPDGSSANDVVQTAVQKILSYAVGEPTDCRAWDPKQDLEKHLKNIIDSEISHYWERHYRRLGQGASESREASLFPGTEDCDDDLLSHIPVVGWEEKQERALLNLDRKVLNSFMEFLRNNKEELLAGIVECIGAHIEKPAEQAEYLEVNVKEIYNVNKKMKRYVQKFRKEMAKQEKLARPKGGN